MSDMKWSEGDWALILGASSGFGEAAALELAGLGLNIVGVHLDRKSTLPNAERIVTQIRELGREVLFFNANAADPDKRTEILNAMKQRGEESGKPVNVRVFMHSLAFGTLKPYIAKSPAEGITKSQMDMTVDVMANSLVYWTQDLVSRKFLGSGSRIFSMTSAGGGSRMENLWSRFCCQVGIGIPYATTCLRIGTSGDYRQFAYGRSHGYSSSSKNSWV